MRQTATAIPASGADYRSITASRPVRLLRTVVMAALVPGTLVTIYAVLRFQQIRPHTEPGLGDLLTTVFFAAGGTICYFTGVVRGSAYGLLAFGKWLLPTLLMVALAADESLMVHEYVSDTFGVSENWAFALYGVLLLMTLYVFQLYRLRTVPLGFWVMLGLFVLACGTSQGAETLNDGREGMIVVGGHSIGAEQVLEMLGALFLCCAFGVLAAHHLQVTPLPPDNA